MCALMRYDAMQVKFLLRDSIPESLTLTASSEKTRWKAEGNDASLRRDERWKARRQTMVTRLMKT